jgi:hypothetical protein
METLHLIPDVERTGFDSFVGVERENIIELKTLEIGGLHNGTEAGNPTVSFAFKLPDGRAVFAETTMALFLTAADALRDLYGDPR